MKKLIILSTLVFLSFNVFSQKGYLWPTITRTEFSITEDGKMGNQKEAVYYYTYYLFTSDTEIVHMTSTITSKYTVYSKDVGEDYIDYQVISDSGNKYTFSFYKEDNAIVILNMEDSYGFTIVCYTPYKTDVLNKF